MMRIMRRGVASSADECVDSSSCVAVVLWFVCQLPTVECCREWPTMRILCFELVGEAK